MKDMLGRDFTIGDQVAHVVRGSTRVSAQIGIVRGLNVIDYTITMEIIAGGRSADIGRLTSPIKEHNVLVIREVD